jgi:hypothetical protein
MAAKKKSGIRTISDLTRLPDKENPRVRTARNRKVIEHSLRTLGTGRSILADENGQIIAGNGTAEAAAKIGITKVRVVPTDGKELIVVQRSDLTAKQKKEMAIADNQASALAEWNPDLESLSEGVDLAPYFTEPELESIAGDETSSFRENLELLPPPNMMWILIGVDVNDYGEILAALNVLESNAKVTVKSNRHEPTKNGQR